MSEISLLRQDLNLLTQRLNDIDNGAKTNAELPVQTQLVLSSLIRVFNGTISETVTIKNILDAAAQLSQQYVDRFTQIGTLSLDSTDLLIGGTWSWLLTGFDLSNNTEPTIPITLSDTGKTRYVRIIATNVGTFEVVNGEQSTGIFYLPPIPPHSLEVTQLIVSDSTISTPTVPVITSVARYVGAFVTEEDLDIAIRRPNAGDFGWVRTTGVLELALYSGTAWQFYDLLSGGSAPTPYRKVFTFSGGAQTFTLDSGVVAKSVFLNKAVLYNDSTSIQEWSQAGDIVTINDSLNTLEIDDQIYILN